jgi:hypothetical protein
VTEIVTTSYRGSWPVVWPDDAAPFDGPHVKELLEENESLRKEVERLKARLEGL